MKSEHIGTGTFDAEVLNVSPHGFWLMVDKREYFLDFDHFPWFRRAAIDELFKIECLHESHLYWPDLDVDLDLDRIEHPERYPLVAGLRDSGEPGPPPNGGPATRLGNSEASEGPPSGS
jgi:hypothetical protein